VKELIIMMLMEHPSGLVTDIHLIFTFSIQKIQFMPAVSDIKNERSLPI
jgi:hypothetical protein